MSNRKRTKFNGKSTIFEAALKNNKMQDKMGTITLIAQIDFRPKC